MLGTVNDVLPAQQADRDPTAALHRIGDGHGTVTAQIVVIEHAITRGQGMVGRHREDKAHVAHGLAVQAGRGARARTHAQRQVGLTRGQRLQRAGERFVADTQARGGARG
jgi:hypothetical protein